MAEPYRFGRFSLDPAERRLLADGVPVPLGPIDFRLLLALVESDGAIIAKDDLMSRVWNRAIVGDHVLHVHINTLRKTIGEDCIVNKQGRGYRFVAPLQRRETRAPLADAASRAGNLPSLWADSSTQEPARLIGRREQLQAIAEMLAQRRLITLTGPGGVGKTRLALQAALEAAPQFCDGAWLVELASLTDGDLVPSGVLSVLGIQVGDNATPRDALSRHLTRKSLLIVLDNCEHVIGAAAAIAELLLAAAPGVKVLATSREPLSCSGEQVLETPALALPDDGETSSDDIRSMPAVELFIARATDADANVQIADDELPRVARICRRLDGLPLAIEMAAGWAGLLGLEALDAKLDGSLKAWLRARNTAPPRHATLRATMEWSYELLSPAEQAVLCRLAVFAGSFTMKAAEAVAGDDEMPKEQVFEHVGSLIRKSMVSIVPGARPQRYRLLETTRAFGLEKLEHAGVSHATGQRHASHVLAVLEDATREWETTSDAAWLDRYGPMLDDMRAALDWAMREEADLAVALAGASWPLWRELSLRAEGRERLSAAVACLRPGTPPALEARLRRGLGAMLLNAAATKAAHEELERSVALYRALNDGAQVGSSITVLAYALFVLGRVAEAEQTIREALHLLQPAGWLRTLAVAYSIQMSIETALGRFDAARAAQEKATRLCEIAGADRTALIVAANQVQLSLERGDVDGAASAGREVTLQLRDTRHTDLYGFALGFLTAALTARGDVDEALAAAREAVPLLRDESTLFWLFDHLALRSALAGRARDAALIAGYAKAAHHRLGRAREPMGRRAVERTAWLLRSALPKNEITECSGLGAQLSEDQAIAIALSG